MYPYENFKEKGKERKPWLSAVYTRRERKVDRVPAEPATQQNKTEQSSVEMKSDRTHLSKKVFWPSYVGEQRSGLPYKSGTTGSDMGGPAP